MAKQNRPSETNPETAVVLFKQSVGDSLANLPAELQQALRRYKTREAVGVAPTWEPQEIGDFIIGEVQTYRIAGKYATPVIVLDTPRGPFSVWLSADLKLKLGTDGIVGKKLIIQFEGWLEKSAEVKIKNRMKVYKVIEVE